MLQNTALEWMLQKEAQTLNFASNLRYLALNIVAVFFFNLRAEKLRES